MKRFLRKAVWYVVAGFVINFMVAWLIAIFVQPQHANWEPSEMYEAESDLYWRVFVNSRRGWTVIHSVWDAEPLFLMSAVSTPQQATPQWSMKILTSSKEQRMLYGAGWPLPACWCEHDVPVGSGSVVSLDGVIPVKLAPWDCGHFNLNRGFPKRLIWTNLSLNALMYALVLPIPLQLIRLARGAPRCRKGNCPACGYRVGKAAQCSECGRALKKCRQAPEHD